MLNGNTDNPPEGVTPESWLGEMTLHEEDVCRNRHIPMNKAGLDQQEQDIRALEE